jgi:Pyrroline-5-carboxylate reductase dimerisation
MASSRASTSFLTVSPPCLQMLEAMADGAVNAGLPRDKAQALAAQTLIGAARMVSPVASAVATLSSGVRLVDALCCALWCAEALPFDDRVFLRAPGVRGFRRRRDVAPRGAQGPRDIPGGHHHRRHCGAGEQRCSRRIHSRHKGCRQQISGAERVLRCRLSAAHTSHSSSSSSAAPAQAAAGPLGT